MVLSQDIFKYDLVAHETLKEHYMPQLLAQAISNGKKVYVEEQPVWIAVDSHEDIPVAEAALKKILPPI